MFVDQEGDSPPDPVSLDQLDLAQLAYFVGLAANDRVLVRLEERGFDGVRASHGFIIQHLLKGPHTVGRLAGLLAISQQAVSKSVAELVRLGYLRDAPSEDGRARTVALSSRGRSLVRVARACRKELEAELIRTAGPRAMAQARRVLLLAVDVLGVDQAIVGRRLRPPR